MKPTRRFALVGSAACTAFAGLAGMAGAEAKPLIAMGRRWLDGECEHAAAWKRFDAAEDVGDKAAADAIYEEINSVADRQHTLKNEIVAAPARSPAGIVTKLRIAAVYARTTNGLEPADELMLSALRDAERLLAG
jgi:hypothetical protein